MTVDTSRMINAKEILTLIPHRYPFLLVDRIVDYTPGESLRAYKNVTINEPFFQGHFPGLPVMPGVLILEALAQSGAVLVVKQSPEPLVDKAFLFAGMDKVKFRRPVVPGDRLDLECFDIKHKRNIWKMSAKATVDGEVAATALLTAAIVDRSSMD
ncbi:3-hydroxyacyl-ACP dehydratase FabZ [Desulfovibrio inopinatus]|uniref:3-hydroxyacyl-ACP dehydratase FabZ n=1 Tax=Desulfovibrio inopinatus TaxID=102109 RepID=UPI0004229BBD|nr:3-hydroxyacyl-ACP dehydratase FabZ [Desulfovibrio inopinatus]